MISCFGGSGLYKYNYYLFFTLPSILKLYNHEVLAALNMLHHTMLWAWSTKNSLLLILSVGSDRKWQTSCALATLCSNSATVALSGSSQSLLAESRSSSSPKTGPCNYKNTVVILSY